MLQFLRPERAILERAVFPKQVHLFLQDTHIAKTTRTGEMPSTPTSLPFMMHLACGNDQLMIVWTRRIQAGPGAESKWSGLRLQWTKKLLDGSLEEYDGQDMQQRMLTHGSMFQ